MGDPKEFLAEVMRRVEERWGESASEGPYARQEIVEGVREVLAAFEADISAVISRAVALIDLEVAAIRERGDRPFDGFLAVLGDEQPRRAPMCRCSLVPELPSGRYWTPEEYELVAGHLAHEGLEARGLPPEQVEEIMRVRAAARATTPAR
jgi:hypothetical protein